MSNSSIWPIDRTPSGATTPDQSRPGSNGNEGVLHSPKLQDKSLTIKWFSVISRTLINGGGGSAEMLCILQSQPIGQKNSFWWNIGLCKGNNLHNPQSIHLKSKIHGQRLLKETWQCIFTPFQKEMLLWGFQQWTFGINMLNVKGITEEN